MQGGGRKIFVRGQFFRKEGETQKKKNPTDKKT